MLGIWLIWLLVIAAYDFCQRRVPNWLSLLGATSAVAALYLNTQPFGLGWSGAIVGAAAGFGFLLIFYITGLMGAGDVKFAGALGLWVGLAPLAPIWIGASLLAAVHAALWLLLQRSQRFPRLTEALSGIPAAGHEAEARKRQRHIPFAAYLAIASLAWLIWRGPPL